MRLKSDWVKALPFFFFSLALAGATKSTTRLLRSDIGGEANAMKTPRVPIDMSRGPSARKKKSGSCVMIPHLPRSLRDVEWCCRLVQPFLGAFYSETVALILFQLRRRTAFVDGNGAERRPTVSASCPLPLWRRSAGQKCPPPIRIQRQKELHVHANNWHHY